MFYRFFHSYWWYLRVELLMRPHFLPASVTGKWGWLSGLPAARSRRLPANGMGKPPRTPWLWQPAHLSASARGQKWLFLPALQSLCECPFDSTWTGSQLQGILANVIHTLFQAKWWKMWKRWLWCWQDPGCDKRKEKKETVRGVWLLSLG